MDRVDLSHIGMIVHLERPATVDSCPEPAVRKSDIRWSCSAPGRIRTCGTRFRKPLLYPLSYGGARRSVKGWSAPHPGAAAATLVPRRPRRPRRPMAAGAECARWASSSAGRVVCCSLGRPGGQSEPGGNGSDSRLIGLRASATAMEVSVAGWERHQRSVRRVPKCRARPRRSRRSDRRLWSR
jgi:hypothetical protein